MADLNAVITSDVHLGSKYTRCEAVIDFVRTIPPGVTLVLNGDIADHWHPHLADRHAEALEVLAQESYRRTVVWVRGNHDASFTPPNPGRIEFVDCYAIDREVFVTHGHDFDNLMPRSRTFLWLFRTLHRVRVFLGAESMHVARYAKRFSLLYSVLRNHVAMNAIEYAKENGFDAIVCGHTHYAEDRVIEGVRYLNTGAWTERPPHCVWIHGRDIRLSPVV